jgi:hypothetical protein
MESWNFFVNNVLPLTVILLGLFGNTMSLIVLARKKLKAIGPVLIYNLLFISDTVYLRK